MQELGPVIFIPVLVAIVIAAIYFSWAAARKRREELSAWASARGLSFSSDKDHSFRDRYPEFACLRQGDRDRYAFNIMIGELRGRHSAAFDYHYETQHSDSKGNTTYQSHYFSAVIVESGLPLKPLSIRPEGFFDKIGEFFGFDDIDFESAEFSRKFHVKSPDKRWAFDVLHARTMQHLMDSPSFNIQFAGRVAIVYRSSRFKPADFDAAAATIAGILDGFPEYLQRQLKEGA